MELFEQIRREFEFAAGASIKSVAMKFRVHRRMVRQALAEANPAERKVPERKRPRIDSVAEFIDLTKFYAPPCCRYCVYIVYPQSAAIRPR